MFTLAYGPSFISMNYNFLNLDLLGLQRFKALQDWVITIANLTLAPHYFQVVTYLLARVLLMEIFLRHK